MDWLLRTVQPVKLMNQSDIYSVVLERISPNEHIKLATFVDALTHSQPSSSDPVRSTILSIICNVESEFEQAAIILVSTSDQSTGILAVLPIVSGLDISISETSASDQKLLNNLNHLSSSIQTEIPKALRCRFSVAGNQLIEVSSDDRQALKDVITEVRRLTSIAKDRQLQRDDLMGPWLDRYTSRKKTFGIGSESIEDKTLSAQDQLSKLLSSPPVSPSPTATTSPTIIVPKPLSIAPDLPEWRQNWLNERLRELEDEYVTSEKIKVRVGTWNVYGKQPTESLQEWLMPEEERDDGADIYVICLQEIDDTSEAYIRYTPFRENHWCEVVHKTLESRHENQRVIKVASQQLIGLLIVVYIKESLFKDVSDVSTSYLGTGTLGMGNKGATAVRLRFCDTYLTFINSHLAAFQEQYEARNRDYFEICRRLSFPTIDRRKFQLDSIPKLKFLGSGPTSPSPTCDIFQTGHLIWAGDLNYRVNMSSKEARALVESSSLEDINVLLSKDQLKQQIELGKAFQHFQEGSIEFKPTYKFDVGRSIYDSSEKQRTPSYTDRILYLPGRTNSIEVLSYQSYPNIKLSDHKPVGSTMMVEVFRIQKDRRDELQYGLLRELDGLENEAVPDVSIEPESLDFKVNKVGDDLGGLIGSSIFIRNIKKFNVSWQILDKPGEVRASEDWLRISQLSGVLQPGCFEQVHFVVDPIGVDQRRNELYNSSSYSQPKKKKKKDEEERRTSDEFNGQDEHEEDEEDEENEEVNDVVVLSVEGGRDIFIPVNVTF